MKYGKYLASQINAEWADKYLDYERLKKMISALSSVQALDVDVARTGFGERTTSLSVVPSKQNSARFNGKDITESDFFTALEAEMSKIDQFVTDQLRTIKREVEQISDQTSSGGAADLPSEEKEGLLKKATSVGAFFLKLEKFVNINYMGVHKILKKHDKMLPVPCRRYYITRLHNQQWVKKDHSKIFVRLGQIHSSLRGDVGGKNEDNGAQGFIRRTTKYWVRTTDISKVKYIVLQHLPVFQHDLEALSGDSQLTNSAYMDNTQLELYHGRLEKSPGAIALRLRWYEDAEPVKAVFMERKTHHDSWTGDVSVKERFILKPAQVMPFLRGEYTVEEKMKEMADAGKSERDQAEVRRLFTEYQQVIDSKQLRPCMRTQYMRVAYQIPFDATVRVSLDTNLTLFCENPKQGLSCWHSNRFYRDPLAPLPSDEVTRFPHAVLEVKLSLKDDEEPPQWVIDLINSGMLTEVHKFSKFVHGCAVLLTEEIQFAPYWIDDASIRASVLRSQHIDVQKRVSGPDGGAAAPALQPMQKIYESGLLGEQTIDLMNSQASFDRGSPYGGPSNKRLSIGGGNNGSYGSVLSGSGNTISGAAVDPGQGYTYGASVDHGLFTPFGQEYAGEERGMLATCLNFCGLGAWCCGKGDVEIGGGGDYKLIPRRTPMKVEPKVFFANERTLLSWLHMSITLGSIAAGLLGVSVHTLIPSQRSKMLNGVPTDEALVTMAPTLMSPPKHNPINAPEVVGMLLLPVSILFAVYALFTFHWRGRLIHDRIPGKELNDTFGPTVLASILIAALSAVFMLFLFADVAVKL